MTALQSFSSPQEEGQASGMPHSHEVEQALLGILLYDNSAFERLPDGLKAEHFYEPFHRRLYAATEDCIRKGLLAEPHLLVDRFKADPAFQELGGLNYLSDMVDRSPPPPNAPDYARSIMNAALLREVIRIGEGAVRAARTGADEHGEPVEGRSLIERTEGELFALAETGPQSGGVVTFASAVVKAVELAAAAFERDGGLSGLSTGLIDLDKKLGGLHPSDLVIIAGRPSMGKTALATNIAFHVAKNYRYEVQPDGSRKTADGGVVLFFSLEMSEEQLAMRILADEAGISSDSLRKGEITASDYARLRDASIEIQSAPLHIDATGGLNIAKLTARARRLKRQVGLDLIVVDYLQLVTTSLRRGEGRVQEVSEITQALKALAKELEVPVIALSQLSRQVEQREDKRPQLSDLRESGSIEQDADAVMFVYRESYYLGRAEPKENTPEHIEWTEQMDRVRGQADLIIGKQRHGPIGTVRLSFNEDTVRFGNLAQEGRYDEYERPSRGPAPATPRVTYSFGGGE